MKFHNATICLFTFITMIGMTTCERNKEVENYPRRQAKYLRDRVLTHDSATIRNKKHSTINAIDDRASTGHRRLKKGNVTRSSCPPVVGSCISVEDAVVIQCNGCFYAGTCEATNAGFDTATECQEVGGVGSGNKSRSCSKKGRNCDPHTSSPTDVLPTITHTMAPTTIEPTLAPPTKSPTYPPTLTPTTELPTISPTTMPTLAPTTASPTHPPTITPTTELPTLSPTTMEPTTFPSMKPSSSPSENINQLEFCPEDTFDYISWCNEFCNAPYNDLTCECPDGRTLTRCQCIC